MLKALMALICSINFITGPFQKLKTDTNKLSKEVVTVYNDISKQIISKKTSCLMHMMKIFPQSIKQMKLY